MSTVNGPDTPRAGEERSAEGGGCRAEGRPASELPLVGERPEVAVASRCELRALTNFATLKNGGCVVAPSAVTEAAGEENPPQTQSWDCWGRVPTKSWGPVASVNAPGISRGWKGTKTAMENHRALNSAVLSMGHRRSQRKLTVMCVCVCLTKTKNKTSFNSMWNAVALE